MSSLRFESMDLTSYDDVKDADNIPGDSIDTVGPTVWDLGNNRSRLLIINFM